MTKEEIFEQIKGEFEDCFARYGAVIHSNIREENGHYTLGVSVEGDVDYDFDIEFNGTPDNFARIVKEGLFAYDAGVLARQNIKKYDVWDIDDLAWYIDTAKELCRPCYDLAEELCEYLHGTWDVRNARTIVSET